MDVDDFQELYKFLRGSKSANPVLDARALFLDNKFDEAYAKLAEAREQEVVYDQMWMLFSAWARLVPSDLRCFRIRTLDRRLEVVAEAHHGDLDVGDLADRVGPRRRRPVSLAGGLVSSRVVFPADHDIANTLLKLTNIAGPRVIDAEFILNP